MKKILIVSYYELKDYFLYIKTLFEQYMFTVSNYPLFRYVYDAHDKLENYEEHMDNYIGEYNPDIILWWFLDVPTLMFDNIKKYNPDKYFIMFNADDSVNTSYEVFAKAKNFDLVVTPCEEYIHLYNFHSGVQDVIHGPMGYDPEIFKQVDNKDYECDISMLTYNLFMDKNVFPNQVVYKPELIDNIIKFSKEHNYKFNLYGSYVLSELYPDNYCGEIPYDKLHLLFNNSKINIISSPDKNRSLYINEYVFPILASGGLLLHDNTKDIDKILENNKNCILYDDYNYLSNIKHILENYDQYIHIKHTGVETATKYSWDNWVENIIKEYGKKYFSNDTYANLYDLNKNDDLLLYWLDTGIVKKEFCFKFSVPENFDYDQYILKYDIKKDIHFAYYHWNINSKHPRFMKKKKKQIGNGIITVEGTTTEDYYISCYLFNKIKQYNTRDDGLKELDIFCSTIPYIKINSILKNYVDNIYETYT
jgi:hypothetical protein